MNTAAHNTDQSLHRNNVQQKKPSTKESMPKDSVYQKKKKPICGDRDHSMSHLWGVSTGREYKGTSWGTIKVLYLFLDGDYI